MQRIDQAAVEAWLRDLLSWREKRSGTIAPGERLPWGETTAMGIQHVLAMFGSTVLAPILMGFDTNVAIFFSAIGTVLFFFITGGRIPSYLGSSFAFIGPVVAVTGYSAAVGMQPGDVDISKALGGIVICGVVYTLIGFVVHYAGSEWIDQLMPPIVTGGVVAIIGLNLAGSARGLAQQNMTLAIITILATIGVAIAGRGLIGRLPILLGTAIGYLVAVILGGVSTVVREPGDLSVVGRDIGPWHITGVELGAVKEAAWIGLPNFTAPSFSGQATLLIAPVAIILVAENTGHIKAVSEMTGKNLMPWLGRGFIGDGVATTLAGFGGGPGVTTYAENIGVMAVTRVFSTAIFLIAAGVAFLLSFSPKFGALVASIPAGVLGGIATVLFGLIAAAGIRIWIDNRVDFSRGVNLFLAAVTLIVGTADYTIRIGDFALNGIALGTFGAIILYQLIRLVPGSLEEDPGATPASAGLLDEYGGQAAGVGVRWEDEERFVGRPLEGERRPRPQRRREPEVFEEEAGMQRPRRQRRPAREEQRVEEPLRPRRRQQAPPQQRPPQQRPPRREQFEDVDEVVIDDPAAMPRPGRPPQQEPSTPPARGRRDEFGFDEPMPMPEPPQPPRAPRRRPRGDQGQGRG